MAQYQAKVDDELYKVYITDALKAISENSARLANGGIYMPERWLEIVPPQKANVRTGREIVAEVIKKAGLKVVSK